MFPDGENESQPMMDKPNVPQHVELRSVPIPHSSLNTTHVVSINGTSIVPPNFRKRMTSRCFKIVMPAGSLTVLMIILILVRGVARTSRRIRHREEMREKQKAAIHRSTSMPPLQQSQLQSDPRSDRITHMVREEQPKFRDSGFAEFNDERSYRESPVPAKLLSQRLGVGIKNSFRENEDGGSSTENGKYYPK